MRIEFTEKEASTIQAAMELAVADLLERSSPLCNRLALSEIEASQALGVSQRTLQRYVEIGIIKVFKPTGGKRLYAVDELRRALAGETTR